MEKHLSHFYHGTWGTIMLITEWRMKTGSSPVWAIFLRYRIVITALEMGKLYRSCLLIKLTNIEQLL